MKPAIGWFALSFILLVLPGSAFPKETWLSKIYFDKWVHIGLFSIFVWLFCRGYYSQNKPSGISLQKKFLYVFIAACVYGIVMEFVQKYFVPNRSFDIGDITADCIGAFVGYIFSMKVYAKK